jgi:gliding motility-associated-like protein
MANDKLIEEIASKLQNHASEVNPQMWSAISSQIGAGAAGTAAAGATFGAAKVAAIAIGVAAIGVASYFAVTSNTSAEETKQTATTEQPKNNTNTETVAPTINTENTAEVRNEQTTKISNKTVVNKTSTIRKVEGSESIQVKEPNTIEIKIPMVTEPIRTIEGSKTTINKKEIKIEEVKPVGTKVESTSKSAYAITSLPNTFTPNGDGTNDYFSVKSTGLSNYSLVVLDKNNKRVWETSDPNAKWDGIGMDGEKVPNGDYIYFVAADGPNGEKVAKYQKLTIQ